MDPTDHLRALLDGVTCTVCEDRDCTACGSTSLGFVMAHASPDEQVANPDAAPISSDDVLDMHAFLARWEGDLAAALRSADRKASRGADHRP
jgi:hypothetical protein